MHFIHEKIRDILTMLFVVGHIGERPLRMSFSRGAIPVGFAASVVLQNEGTRQQVFWDLKPMDELELSLPDFLIGLHSILIRCSNFIHISIKK